MYDNDRCCFNMSEVCSKSDISYSFANFKKCLQNVCLQCCLLYKDVVKVYGWWGLWESYKIPNIGTLVSYSLKIFPVWKVISCVEVQFCVFDNLFSALWPILNELPLSLN